MTTKIGIIGTGNMGRVIGLSLAQMGHEVFFGSRDQSKAKSAADMDDNTASGSNQQAAEFGKIIYYSPRDVHPDTVLTDISCLDNKIVIDSHNHSNPDTPLSSESGLSKSQILQKQLPNAKVVKAFNTISQEIFEYTNKNLRAYGVSCFVASDHEDASETVVNLANELGFIGVNCGNLNRTVLLEQAGSLIRILMELQQTPWISFSIAELPAMANLRFGVRIPPSVKSPSSNGHRTSIQ